MKVITAKFAVFLLIAIPAHISAGETLSLSYTAENSVHVAAGKKLQQAYSKIGVTVNLVPLPAERALQSANSGASDGIVVNTIDLQNLTKTTYTNLVMVPKPVCYLNAHHFNREMQFYK